MTAHHRLMLQIYKDSIADREGLIKRLDAEIEKATAAYQIEIDLLQTIPGVGKDSAITIISETGVDTCTVYKVRGMDKFADAEKMSSWSGMCPGNNESGGKKKLQKQSKVMRTFKAH